MSNCEGVGFEVLREYEDSGVDFSIMSAVLLPPDSPMNTPQDEVQRAVEEAFADFSAELAQLRRENSRRQEALEDQNDQNAADMDVNISDNFLADLENVNVVDVLQETDTSLIDDDLDVFVNETAGSLAELVTPVQRNEVNTLSHGKEPR
jgi:hypothetical protein